MQFLQDRESKVQEVYQQFQYKDEIIELLAQKVKLFQDECKKEVIPRNFIVSTAQQEREIQTDLGLKHESSYGDQTSREKDRVIVVYEKLLKKIKAKLEDKVAWRVYLKILIWLFYSLKLRI